MRRYSRALTVTHTDPALQTLGIHGIGVDIVETARIESSLTRFGERFIARIFTDAERAYCASMPHPARHYAARFAAKEAVSKAFGTGIGQQLGWRDIEVKKKPTGEPYLQLHGPAALLADERRITRTFITLSHSDHYSVAQALLISSV